MAAKQLEVEGDVLAVSEHSSGEFSGFSPQSEDAVPKEKILRKKKRTKSKSSTSKTSTEKNKLNMTADTGGVGNFDLSKLTSSDVDKLRTLLGINPPANYVNHEDDQDIHSMFGSSLDSLPNMRVEFNPNDLSGGESPVRNKSTNISSGMSNALFDQENQEVDEWDLPKLRVPERGDSIAKSLASMIDTACTSQCETDSLVAKYKVPQNCEMVTPPTVNPEIWKIMDRRVQSQDRSIVETQNLLSASMIPIIKLAETLKPHIMANSAAKTLLSDALTLIGQVQYNLSVRRRYMIRPVLKKKYHSLCSISMPISTKLFGDDVSKDIKSCDSLISLGKEQYQRQNYQNKGRGSSKRGSYGNNTGRYQPYQNKGQKSWSKNYKIPKKTATATAPNEQSQ